MRLALRLAGTPADRAVGQAGARRESPPPLQPLGSIRPRWARPQGEDGGQGAAGGGVQSWTPPETPPMVARVAGPRGGGAAPPGGHRASLALPWKRVGGSEWDSPSCVCVGGGRVTRAHKPAPSPHTPTRLSWSWVGGDPQTLQLWPGAELQSQTPPPTHTHTSQGWPPALTWSGGGCYRAMPPPRCTSWPRSPHPSAWDNPPCSSGPAVCPHPQPWANPCREGAGLQQAGVLSLCQGLEEVERGLLGTQDSPASRDLIPLVLRARAIL